MKMFIPEIGSKIKLTDDWPFRLYVEYRNTALLSAAKWPVDNTYLYRIRRQIDICEIIAKNWSWEDDWNCFTDVVMPAGTILGIDRIYIRKGAKEFSSVSFNVDRKSIDGAHSSFAQNLNSARGRCRFWAKLNDVNKIEFGDLQVS